jgi:hypothetical protein
MYRWVSRGEEEKEGKRGRAGKRGKKVRGARKGKTVERDEAANGVAKMRW